MRCAAVRAPHHGRAALLRLCPPGPQDGPRTPISAKLVANLITMAGANRVLTLDLHAGQIQALRHSARQPGRCAGLVRHIQETTKNGDQLVIVSPDVGGVVARPRHRQALDADLAIIDKRRERAACPK
jgi:ribose-phosphate pyrophosphokinase